ncbi:hypothetical protein BD31_I1886 [Candidatus Nitrosopumilus salaria BD31]|uniref:Uncharacterized protein n=1 Tax=Candidatus Nitrosopumilus salarius BD31 TaxID=859350 RepID=I3D1U8_9ARCH|nr:hypothetical protein BD31_I1886 [Candidatus Nitrosopumilus salaria BD31]
MVLNALFAMVLANPTNLPNPILNLISANVFSLIERVALYVESDVIMILPTNQKFC